MYLGLERALQLPGAFDFYNQVEQEVLGFSAPPNERLAPIINLIKQLAMELSRQNPTDWNNFMDVSLW